MAGTLSLSAACNTAADNLGDCPLGILSVRMGFVCAFCGEGWGWGWELGILRFCPADSKVM